MKFKLGFNHDPESDAVYLRLRETEYGEGRELDDAKHIDLDVEGNVLGIEPLYVSGWSGLGRHPGGNIAGGQPVTTAGEDQGERGGLTIGATTQKPKPRRSVGAVLYPVSSSRVWVVHHPLDDDAHE